MVYLQPSCWSCLTDEGVSWFLLTLCSTNNMFSRTTTQPPQPAVMPLSKLSDWPGPSLFAHHLCLICRSTFVRWPKACSNSHLLSAHLAPLSPIVNAAVRVNARPMVAFSTVPRGLLTSLTNLASSLCLEAALGTSEAPPGRSLPIWCHESALLTPMLLLSLRFGGKIRRDGEILGAMAWLASPESPADQIYRFCFVLQDCNDYNQE